MPNYFKNINDLIVLIAFVMISLILLFATSGLFLIGPAKKEIINQLPVLLELDKNSDESEVIKHLKSLPSIDQNTIEFIPKDHVSEVYGDQIDGALLERLKSNDIFKNIIKFSFNKDSVNSLNSARYETLSVIPGVATVTGNMSSYTATSPSNPLKYKLLYLLPLFIALIIIWSVITLSFERNKSDIRALLTSGGNPGFVRKQLSRKAYLIGIKAWIVAVFLFLLGFYLLNRAVGLNFSNFNVIRLFLVLFIPLAIVILFSGLLISNLIKSLLKSN